MTNSPRSVLRGSQLPRVDHTPLFHSSAGDDAVDLAAVAGLNLDEWQQHVLRGSLGERPDGRWQAFEVGLVVPRQNGKGSILEARELAGMFLFGERMIIHTAHLFSTAKEHQMRIESLIRGSELVEYMKGFQGDPNGVMTGIKTGNSEMAFTHKNGNRIKFLARSGGNSGRGFTGDLVVLDEAYNLPDSVIAAMMPTMAARSMTGSPQIWYTSSAGMPESAVLRRVRERGLNPDDEPRLAYYEWSVADDANPDEPVNWAQANPALGIRIAPDFVENERRTLDDEEFKRERLGIWAKEGGSSVIPPGKWDEALDEFSEPGPDVAFGVDVPYDRSSASIAVASVRDDGLIHVEVVDRRPDTDWVMPRIEELRRKWRPVGIAFDAASQTADVAASNARVKRKMLPLDGRTYMQSCGAFFSEVMAGRVRHTGQEDLTLAVERARRSKGATDLWRWAKEDRADDISPLVAVTLAVKALEESERKKQRKMVIY
ncbi:hypothetical protein [uncultured Rothia sp.]|uniref:hypothetical protein n=1 Tax=uncultured Rothia sp. TaxID=316088 RepID=UPI0032173D53